MGWEESHKAAVRLAVNMASEGGKDNAALVSAVISVGAAIMHLSETIENKKGMTIQEILGDE